MQDSSISSIFFFQSQKQAVTIVVVMVNRSGFPFSASYRMSSALENTKESGSRAFT